MLFYNIRSLAPITNTSDMLLYIYIYIYKGANKAKQKQNMGKHSRTCPELNIGQHHEEDCEGNGNQEVDSLRNSQENPLQSLLHDKYD